MGTLEDLAGAIDAAVEESVPSTAEIQSLIVSSIAAVTGLSIEQVYSLSTGSDLRTMDFLYTFAANARVAMLATATARYVSQATDAASTSVMNTVTQAQSVATN